MNTTVTQNNRPVGSEGKTLQGVVVKAAMKDTCTVEVSRYVQHPKYKKYYTSSKKFLVHDQGNTAGIGDKVTIRETRPMRRKDGSYVRFDENAVVLVVGSGKEPKDPKASRVFGPIPREVVEKGYNKIGTMAPEIV